LCIKAAEIRIDIDPGGICEDRHNLIINKTMTPAGKMRQNPLTLHQRTPDLFKLPVVKTKWKNMACLRIDLYRNNMWIVF
jgi:hypothetical protein